MRKILKGFFYVIGSCGFGLFFGAATGAYLAPVIYPEAKIIAIIGLFLSVTALVGNFVLDLILVFMPIKFDRNWERVKKALTP